MELYQILLEEINRRKKDRLVHLPNSGISYIPQPHCYLIELNPVGISEILNFRKQIEKEILKRKNQRLVFWSYDSNQNTIYYDAVIDFLRFRLDLTEEEEIKGKVYPPTNQIEGIIYYHTPSNQEFLSRFLPIATELVVLDITWDPKTKDSKKDLDEKINDYLILNHNISYRYFKRLMRQLQIPEYVKRPSYEKITDFIQTCNIFLGSLAIMRQKFGITVRKYKENLERVKILGLKRNYFNPMLESVLSELIQRT